MNLDGGESGKNDGGGMSDQAEVVKVDGGPSVRNHVDGRKSDQTNIPGLNNMNENGRKSVRADGGGMSDHYQARIVNVDGGPSDPDDRYDDGGMNDQAEAEKVNGGQSDRYDGGG